MRLPTRGSGAPGIARWLCWTAVLAATALPVPAHAQGSKGVPPEANKLYEEAAAAMIKKNYAVACPKFEQVSRMVPDGGGVRLNLAECYEEQGKLASAYVQYGIAETLAKKDGRKDRSKAAVIGAARIKPKLAMVVIDVPDTVRSLPDLVIKLDGEVLGDKLWGVPSPVDRGAHTVDVAASGYKPSTLRIDVPKDGVTKSAVVPPLEVAPHAPPPADVGPGPVVTKDSPAKEEGVSSSPLRTATVIGGGALALGGIAAGAAMLGVSFSKADELRKAKLDPFGFEAAKAAAAAKADAQNTAIWCFVGGGVAAVGTGVFYLVTRPKAPPKVTAGAFVGPQGSGVWVQGRF